MRYHITEGARNPYTASIRGNLRHWLEKDPEIMKLYETLPYFRELRRLEEHACSLREEVPHGVDYFRRGASSDEDGSSG